MMRTTNYKGWVIFRESGTLTGYRYYAALSLDDYKAALQGESRWPIRDTTFSRVKLAIDKFNPRDPDNSVSALAAQI